MLAPILYAVLVVAGAVLSWRHQAAAQRARDAVREREAATPKSTGFHVRVQFRRSEAILVFRPTREEAEVLVANILKAMQKSAARSILASGPDDRTDLLICVDDIDAVFIREASSC